MSNKKPPSNQRLSRPAKKDHDVDLRTIVGQMPANLRSAFQKMFQKAKTDNKELRQVFNEELARLNQAQTKPKNPDKK